MKRNTIPSFKKGFVDAFPVFISYFLVSLALGINATEAGISPFQASLMSFLNLTSAGQAAGIEIIRNQGSYTEIILSQLAINMRYLLMAAALTIKIDSKADSLFKRLLMSMGITDENFALTAAQKGSIDPLYTYGCFWMSMPGWVAGTYIGATIGNIFPQRITMALSIALYAMFCAIILTPAKGNPVLVMLVVFSMILSWIFTEYVAIIPFGIRVMLLSVVLAAVAAALFPIKEDSDV